MIIWNSAKVINNVDGTTTLGSGDVNCNNQDNSHGISISSTDPCVKIWSTDDATKVPTLLVCSKNHGQTSIIGNTIATNIISTNILNATNDITTTNITTTNIDVSTINATEISTSTIKTALVQATSVSSTGYVNAQYFVAASSVWAQSGTFTDRVDINVLNVETINTNSIGYDQPRYSSDGNFVTFTVNVSNHMGDYTQSNSRTVLQLLDLFFQSGDFYRFMSLLKYEEHGNHLNAWNVLQSDLKYNKIWFERNDSPAGEEWLWKDTIASHMLSNDYTREESQLSYVLPDFEITVPTTIHTQEVPLTVTKQDDVETKTLTLSHKTLILAEKKACAYPKIGDITSWPGGGFVCFSKGYAAVQTDSTATTNMTYHSYTTGATTNGTINLYDLWK